MRSTPTPMLGDTVIYRSRTGLYSLAAIVAGTQESLYQPNVVSGLVPPLSSDGHVHLVVLSPGPAGKRVEATDFKVESAYHRSENAGGTYTEWDIGEDTSDGEQEPGTWRWPPER